MTFSGVDQDTWWLHLHKAFINDQGGTQDAKYSASLEQGAVTAPFSPALRDSSANSVGNSHISSLVTIDFYKAHSFLVVVRKMP